MSADQVTSNAGGGATGGALGSVTGLLQGGVSYVINMGKNLLDKVLPAERREAIKEKLTKFATEKPYLASFLFSQIALSGLPMFLFIVMTVSVVIFALIVGLLVGLIGAVLFILAAVGFALVILLPTLFFTTFLAVGVWLWGMAAWYIIKAFNEKDVPGIHKPLGESLKNATGMSDLVSSTNGQAQDEKPQTNGTAENPKAKHLDKQGRGQKVE